jgi:HEAT repeat protein
MVGTTLVDAMNDLVQAQGKDERVRAGKEIRALRARGAGATPVLLEALCDPEEEVRREVLFTLSVVLHDHPSIASYAGEAIPALTSYLQTTSDPDFMRADAGRVLGFFGMAALPAILELLDSTDRAIKKSALSAFVFFPARERKAALSHVQSAVLRHLTHPDAGVRCRAACSMWTWGEGASGIVLYLAELLNDGRPLVVKGVLWTLERLGTHAYKAIPALVALIERSSFEGDQDLHRAASWTLAAMGAGDIRASGGRVRAPRAALENVLVGATG